MGQQIHFIFQFRLAFYVWVWFRSLLLWEDVNTNLVAKNNKYIVLQFLMSEVLPKSHSAKNKV